MISPFPLKFIRGVGLLGVFVSYGFCFGFIFVLIFLGVFLGHMLGFSSQGVCFGFLVGPPMYTPRRFPCIPRGALYFFYIYNITYQKTLCYRLCIKYKQL
jgi:hypothetical protein